MSDLIISNNRWWSEHKYSNATILVDGVFNSVVDVVIESNAADDKWAKKSTRATVSITVPPNASLATIDFTQDLLFDGIPPKYVTCSVWSDRPTTYSVVPRKNTQSWGEGERHGCYQIATSVAWWYTSPRNKSMSTCSSCKTS